MNDQSDRPPPVLDPEEFTEYGYLSEWPDGFRCAVSLLGTDREQALSHFQTYRPETRGERLIFVSRQVTRTPWTDEEAPAHD